MILIGATIKSLAYQTILLMIYTVIMSLKGVVVIIIILIVTANTSNCTNIIILKASMI